MPEDDGFDAMLDKPKSNEKNRGRKSLLPHLPLKGVEHDLPESEKVCGCYQGELIGRADKGIDHYRAVDLETEGEYGITNRPTVAAAFQAMSLNTTGIAQSGRTLVCHIDGKADWSRDPSLAPVNLRMRDALTSRLITLSRSPSSG